MYKQISIPILLPYLNSLYSDVTLNIGSPYYNVCSTPLNSIGLPRPSPCTARVLSSILTRVWKKLGFSCYFSFIPRDFFYIGDQLLYFWFGCFPPIVFPLRYLDFSQWWGFIGHEYFGFRANVSPDTTCECGFELRPWPSPFPMWGLSPGLLGGWV
ncbi:hypothetical protein BGS_0116 [Beggiatoa sp. SS]|nr:hypothetical protein BGS_0116 [Beggiatoa sp. SS]